MTDYTIKEAARLLDMKEAKIRNMLTNNVFPFATTKVGRRRMINKEQVDQHIADMDLSFTASKLQPVEAPEKTPDDLREQKARIEKTLKAKGLIA